MIVPCEHLSDPHCVPQISALLLILLKSSNPFIVGWFVRLFYSPRDDCLETLVSELEDYHLQLFPFSYHCPIYRSICLTQQKMGGLHVIVIDGGRNDNKLKGEHTYKQPITKLFQLELFRGLLYIVSSQMDVGRNRKTIISMKQSYYGSEMWL